MLVLTRRSLTANGFGWAKETPWNEAQNNIIQVYANAETNDKNQPR